MYELSCFIDHAIKIFYCSTYINHLEARNDLKTRKVLYVSSKQDPTVYKHNLLDGEFVPNLTALYRECIV